MSDPREALAESIRRGLLDASVIGDPDQIEEYVDSVMAELLTCEDGRVGWLLLGDLEHVYRVEHSRMTDATPAHHSVWAVQTANDQ